MTAQTSNTSVTGRDDYIMAKALYWALKFSQRQPDSFREWGDEEDIEAILNSRFGMFAAGFKLADENTLKLIREAEAEGDRETDHAALVAYVTPPDLSEDPAFLEDGSTPTPDPEFIEEELAKSLAQELDKNRRDLAESIRQTLAAFGLDHASVEAKRLEDDRRARAATVASFD